MKKFIELHCHLDGTITVEIAKALAALQNITLTTDDDVELEKLLTVSSDCGDLNEFLACFDLPVSLLQTREGLCEAAYLVCEKLHRDGVIYAELRYAPQLHTSKGLTQEDAICAVIEGITKSTLRTNLILCCMRGEGNEAENDETVELAKKYLVKDGGVVAIDLAGAEALYPTQNYADLFAKAKSYGIPFTIHAGEADGPRSVELAIQYGAARIGHGTRIREDETVLQLVKNNNIPLEMCPTSNLQTCAVSSLSDHPFMDYLKVGLRVTLNTDDPAIEGIDPAHEYRLMAETFDLTAEDEKTILNNAVDAAFTTDEVKAELRAALGLN